MTSYKWRTATLSLILLAASSPATAQADTLRISEYPGTDNGQFVEIRDGMLLFIKNNGVLAEYHLSAIEELRIDTPVLVTNRNGDKINTGTAVVSARSVAVAGSDSKITFVPQENVAAITRIRDDSQAGSRPVKTTGGDDEATSASSGSAETPDFFPEEMIVRDRSSMDKGSSELETTFILASTDQSAPLLGPDKWRTAGLDITYRYGLGPASLFATMPLSLEYHEEIQDVETTSSTTSAAFGNIALGTNWQINRDEKRGLPSVTFSLTGKVPTASQSNVAFWDVTPGISFIKTTDPAVLYGGFSYTYTIGKNIARPLEFESVHDTVTYKPGNELAFFLGGSFAVNEKLAFTCKVEGHFVERLQLDGRTLGDTKTPMGLSLGVGYAIDAKNYLEPTLTFPISKDNETTAIALAYIRKFN